MPVYEVEIADRQSGQTTKKIVEASSVKQAAEQCQSFGMVGQVRPVAQTTAAQSLPSVLDNGMRGQVATLFAIAFLACVAWFWATSQFYENFYPPESVSLGGELGSIDIPQPSKMWAVLATAPMVWVPAWMIAMLALSLFRNADTIRIKTLAARN